jgi:hypothetical protein
VTSDQFYESQKLMDALKGRKIVVH